MNLLVLGASNEIITSGYIYQMNKMDINNLSIGGSCVSAGVFSFIKFMEEKPDCNFDFTILNYELNEHLIINNANLRTVDEVLSMWDWLIVQNKINDIKPVIIVLPRIENNKIVRTSTCDIHAELAKKHEIPFIDIASAFVELAKNGIDIFSLMRDNAHMSEASMQVVGDSIQNYLFDIFDKYNISIETTNVTDDYYNIYSSSFLPEKQVQHRKTSLCESKLATYHEDEEFLIEKDIGDTFIGFALNRCSMPGGVIVSNKCCKKILFSQARKDAYMSAFIDYKYDEILTKNPLKFSVGPLSISATEPTWLSLHKFSIPKEKSCIEIEAALMKRNKVQNVKYINMSLPEEKRIF